MGGHGRKPRGAMYSPRVRQRRRARTAVRSRGGWRFGTAPKHWGCRGENGWIPLGHEHAQRSLGGMGFYRVFANRDAEWRARVFGTVGAWCARTHGSPGMMCDQGLWSDTSSYVPAVTRRISLVRQRVGTKRWTKRRDARGYGNAGVTRRTA